MKLLTILFSALLIFGCASEKTLSREEAFQQLQQDKSYPHEINYDIYCSDPEAAKKVLDAGLETEGLVTVQRTQKLGDVGKPLINFTEKAQSYFLSTTEKDKARYIQKVKIADEDLAEVTNIKTNEPGNKAVVEYTTSYKNVTPFSSLIRINYKEAKTNKAYFSLGEQGWKFEKKPDVDFVQLEKELNR